jgi:preprotein translocase subunit SecA
MTEEVGKEAGSTKKERQETPDEVSKKLQRTIQMISRMTTKIIKKEEEEEACYNVAVYAILPYPPNTKDPKDFFIQRT